MFDREIEFFRLETNGIDFREILKEIDQKKNVSLKEGGKVLEEGAFEVSLLKFKDGNDYCDGLVARSNKDDLPLAGNFYTKVIRFLNLKKDEGLIDMTYFCYIRNLTNFCLLPARKEAKWGTFKSYIQSVHLMKNKFDLHPLFNKKIMEIYKKMGAITSIDTEINIGNNSSPSSKDIKNTPLKDLIESAENANASRIKVEVYKEKREGGLKIGPIKRLVEFCMDLGILYRAESIKVRGSESAEESDLIIDLIKDKFKLPVKLGSNSRYLNFKECCKIAHDAINRHWNEIEELIK